MYCLGWVSEMIPNEVGFSLIESMLDWRTGTGGEESKSLGLVAFLAWR
jgi:hypothetical protein